jgi:tetratricopeptide (TPR) repeat protein
MFFGKFGETTIPKSYENLAGDPNVPGWLLLASGRFAEAAKHFEAQIVTRHSFPLNRFPLAITLDRVGRLDEAIARLEEEEIPHNNVCSDSMWPLYRAKLAELYRKVGRIDDAVKVENQLRHYLSEADPDYPILAQLRAAEAATPRIARAK